MSTSTHPPATSAADIHWDLSALYQGPDDPALVSDRELSLAEARRFAADYRERLSGLRAAELAEAVRRLETIMARATRPLIFAHLRFAADTATPANGALLQAAQEHMTAVREHLLFFELEWTALPEAEAARLLADPSLAHHRHFLTVQRTQRPHLLSEPEERVLNVKDNTGRTAFQRLFDEVVSGLRCPVGDRELSLQEALALLYDGNREQRRAAADGVTAALRAQQRVLGFIFNTLVLDHADNDRLRHRDHPMLARNLDNEIDQASVDALLDACDRRMGLVSRYYDLKRRLLGYETLYDYDRYAPIGTALPACPFDEARRIVLDAYNAFSPEMAQVAEKFFAGRWIDAALRPGKTGGAFSAGTVPEVHPYILLNYTDTLRDVMTLAHELGHGVHQYLAREQGLFQFRTPLTTAETASVFGEMLVFHRLMAAQDDPSVKLALLCSKLEDIFATSFRQAVLTRFEQKLHEARRTGGEQDAAAIGSLWREANAPMFGDAVAMSDGYTWWWAYISHFVHTPFYCYAYCFGELLVLALYRQYEEQGGAFASGYLALLKAGGAVAPPELLGRMGLDITSPDFWDKGLDLLEDMLGQAEALAATARGA